MFHGQSQQHEIEIAVDQFLEQSLRLRLAQMQVEIGMARADQGEKLREQVGRDRGNGAQPERPGEGVREVPGAVHQVAHVGEHACGANGNFPSTRG